MRDLSFPHIYLSNHLLTSVWTQRYLFYILGINPILLYFIAQIVSSLAVESSFSWLPILSGFLKNFYCQNFFQTSCTISQASQVPSLGDRGAKKEMQGTQYHVCLSLFLRPKSSSQFVFPFPPSVSLCLFYM